MGNYRITIKGRLTERFTAAFVGMRLVPGPSRTTLVGAIKDQAHLFGVLERIRSLGLDLISVEPEDEPT
jgi:hypothetical protein